MGCAIREIEKRCLRYVDAIITVSVPFANYLRKFNPATEIVYNCPRTSDIPRLPKPETRHELGLPPDAFIVSYVGTIRHDFALDLLLDVASSVKNPSVEFLVVGDGPLARGLLETATVRQARLSVLPRVSRERALRYVSASDLTWAVYKGESLNMRFTMPWKFFESLACGVPLIVEEGTLRAEFVKRLRCGIVLEGRDPHQISELIVSLASDRKRYHEMRVASNNAALGMTWETMSCKLTETYERLYGLYNTG
jgi:glycosyltransferase involved in cell wall biosynthesis